MKLAAFPKCFMDALCVERTMTVFDWIALAHRELGPLGVAGLEMYPGFLATLEPDYLAQVRQALDEAGMEMPMFCASPDFTAPDPAVRRAEVERERTMIRVSAALGGNTCRVLSGQRRPDVGREQGITWVEECIRAVLDCAEEHSIVLTIENHFKDNYWQYPEFAQRMDVFCEIVDRIESPWFGVNYDPSNALIANDDPLALLRRVARRVVTVHASDRRPRPGSAAGSITDYAQLIHGEVGTGSINYPAIFSILRDAGFDGWVSIEDGVNGIDEMKRSAVFLARLMHLRTAADPAA